MRPTPGTRRTSPAGRPRGIVAPIIPGLNDHEIPAIIDAARAAGAVHAGYVMLRLPYTLKELFEGWLRQHFPARASKVLSRLRAVRGGRLNTATFGARRHGEGPLADAVEGLFRVACRRANFPGRVPLSTAAFRRPDETPPLLFGVE